MITNDLARIWAASAHVHDGKGLIVASRRARFFVRALGVYGAVKPFIHAPPQSSLGRLMAERPDMLGAVTWPYQCLGWDARTRLTRICEHCSIVDYMGQPLNFPVDGQLRLLDLDNIRAGFHVVLDQPQWFMREGQFAINLFLNETRLYSLVFSLFRDREVSAAFVGAIQGRDIDGILDEYRNLTKAAHGMRPRDLLIEVFRMFGETIGLKRILAVSDEHRQHRSNYYGKSALSKLSGDYNEIWQERGGTRVDSMVYSLDVTGRERDLETVPAKKRGMYRRRYEMLQVFRQQLQANWRDLQQGGRSIGAGRGARDFQEEHSGG